MSKVNVEITDLNSAGEGVGRLESGQVVFVPFALPGETVKVSVIEKKKNRAKGRLEQVTHPSPYRREPKCPLFYSCGGCSLLHLDYEKQLEWKRTKVKESLTRLGKLQDVDVLPVLKAPDSFHYRNKITLHWEQQRKDNKPVLGFHRPGTNQVVEVKHCLLASKKLNETLGALHDVLSGDMSAAKGLKGKIQVTLRHSRYSDETMVVFSTPEGAEQAILQIITELQDKFPGLASGWHFSGKQTLHRFGRKQLQEKLLHCTFTLGPKDFFQVNPQQAERLFQEVLNRLDGMPRFKGLVDLHCGTGVLSLLAAGRAEKIYGIDSFGPAVENARGNTGANGIDNVSFFHGAAEKVLPRLLKSSPVEVALLNPPRQGCSQSLLNTLAQAEIPLLAYLSCNAATLSRDLKQLTDQGYKTGPVQPVDMFPQTNHVECCVLIEKK